MSGGLSPEPVVWAEFCILKGRGDAPEIHARLDPGSALDALLEVLREADGDAKVAKAAFLKQIERWVRRG